MERPDGIRDAWKLPPNASEGWSLIFFSSVNRRRSLEEGGKHRLRYRRKLPRSDWHRILRVSVCSSCSLHVLHVVFFFFFYPLTWQEARGFGISAERNAVLSSTRLRTSDSAFRFSYRRLFVIPASQQKTVTRILRMSLVAMPNETFRMSIRRGRMRYLRDFVRSSFGQPISNVVSWD